MVTLNIHWERFSEKDFNQIKKLADLGPIAISPSPRHLSLIPEEQKEWVRTILKKPGYLLGQQGLTHKCEKCSKFHVKKESNQITKAGIDSWHENYCLWLGSIPEDEQEKLMVEGRRKLQEAFGTEPSIYVPPNHYFDETTIRVASRLGYRWLSDRAEIPLNPYTSNGIIIVPESEPEIKRNQHLYIHSDRWRGNLEKAIEKGLESIEQIKPEERDETKIKQNREIKILLKLARDLHKGFNVPKEDTESLARLFYETKFANDLFL